MNFPFGLLKCRRMNNARNNWRGRAVTPLCKALAKRSPQTAATGSPGRLQIKHVLSFPSVLLPRSLRTSLSSVPFVLSFIGVALKVPRVSHCAPTSVEANKAKCPKKILIFFPATFVENHWQIHKKCLKKSVKITQKTREFRCENCFKNGGCLARVDSQGLFSSNIS